MKQYNINILSEKMGFQGVRLAQLVEHDTKSQGRELEPQVGQM